MKKLVFVFILIFFTNYFTYGQNPYAPGITVEFAFKSKKINYKDELDIIIRFKNNSKDTLYIYSPLIVGTKFEQEGNVYCEIEEYVNEKFVRRKLIYPGKTIKADTTVQSSKVSISPQSEVSQSLNIFTKISYLKKGDYRIKLFLLRLDPNLKDMQYVESKWFRFKLLRDIIVKS